jgi:hypothetical protein
MLYLEQLIFNSVLLFCINNWISFFMYRMFLMVNGFVHHVFAGFVDKANSTWVVRMDISLHACSVNINVSVLIHKYICFNISLIPDHLLNLMGICVHL